MVDAALAKERMSSNLDINDISLNLYDREQLDLKSQALQFIETNPELFQRNAQMVHQVSQNAGFEEDCKVFKRLYLLRKEKKLPKQLSTDEGFLQLCILLNGHLMTLHYGMCLPTLKKILNEDQLKEWIQPMEDLEIIFTYAQTELGHGTWLKRLMTTATFDSETQEFVLDSNGTPGYKFWPGFLGFATHALTMATLIVGGKKRGPHLFIVPLRNLQTFQPLMGIDIGSIGMTGMNNKYNGFVGFKSVRIPRTNMPMKYSQVTNDGGYIKEGNDKILYSGMVIVRLGVIGFSAIHLARSATVAIRYSIIRRQSQLKLEGDEEQIINYATQQDKIFPYIALAYALIFCSKRCAIISQRSENTSGDIHGIFSALKAYSTSRVLEGTMRMRQACGGHGFSLSSGLKKLIMEADGACTYEGENTVMFLQSARYIMTCLKKIMMETNISKLVDYLTDDSVRSPANFTCVQDLLLKSGNEILIKAFRRRAQWAAEQAFSKLQAFGKELEIAWNESGIDLVAAAWTFAEYFVVESFMVRIEKSVLSSPNFRALNDLCLIAALHAIVEGPYSGGFILCGYFSPQQVKICSEALYLLFDRIRPEVLLLVEAFEFSDFQLASTIGEYNGHPYENLMKFAQESETNDPNFLNKMFQKYLRNVTKPSSKL